MHAAQASHNDEKIAAIYGDIGFQTKTTELLPNGRYPVCTQQLIIVAKPQSLHKNSYCKSIVDFKKKEFTFSTAKGWD